MLTPQQPDRDPLVAPGTLRDMFEARRAEAGPKRKGRGQPRAGANQRTHAKVLYDGTALLPAAAGLTHIRDVQHHSAGHGPVNAGAAPGQRCGRLNRSARRAAWAGVGLLLGIAGSGCGHGEEDCATLGGVAARMAGGVGLGHDTPIEQIVQFGETAAETARWLSQHPLRDDSMTSTADALRGALAGLVKTSHELGQASNGLADHIAHQALVFSKARDAERRLKKAVPRAIVALDPQRMREYGDLFASATGSDKLAFAEVLIRFAGQIEAERAGYSTDSAARADAAGEARGLATLTRAEHDGLRKFDEVDATLQAAMRAYSRAQDTYQAVLRAGELTCHAR